MIATKINVGKTFCRGVNTRQTNDDSTKSSVTPFNFLPMSVDFALVVVICVVDIFFFYARNSITVQITLIQSHFGYRICADLSYAVFVLRPYVRFEMTTSTLLTQLNASSISKRLIQFRCEKMCQIEKRRRSSHLSNLHSNQLIDYNETVSLCEIHRLTCTSRHIRGAIKWD